MAIARGLGFCRNFLFGLQLILTNFLFFAIYNKGHMKFDRVVPDDMLNKNAMDGSLAKWKGHLPKWMQKGKTLLLENRVTRGINIHKQSLLLIVMAFLLGRAMILQELSPFAVAYFAAISNLKRNLVKWAGFSLLLGSLLSYHPLTAILAMELLVFYLIHRGLEKYDRAEISYAPMLVFLAVFAVRMFSHMTSDDLTWYHLMMTFVESVLSFVLTLIFLQSLPLFTLEHKQMQLKHEEMICLMILFASVMTGTVGWAVGDVFVEHVLSRYFILVFALVGGAPLGASVGVITGLILSLADIHSIVQMSLLAFAGLLAGLMKEGGKWAVAFGLFLGASILSVYVGTQSEVMQSTWESLAAAVLFLLTPGKWMMFVARYVPGTQENMKSQYDYAKKVRDITASRVEQFSEVFRQLSGSFRQFANDGQAAEKEEDVGHFMNAVASRSCSTCWKKEACWDNKFYQTYKWMTDMMSAIEENPQMEKEQIPAVWRKLCVKSDQVLEQMKVQYEHYKHNRHWKKQIHDSRHLVAEQLSGVSQVMEDLAKEIKREGQALYLQEEQIRREMEKLGLSIQSIDVISLDEGNVEIEIVHKFPQGFDECRKIIAPLLSNILGENISVKHEQYIGRDGFYNVTFGSAKEYEVETGIAGAAKGGGLLSGDSFSALELGNGKYAVAISDGMGNGVRARAESSAALSILQQLLKTGIDEKLAVKSVNSVLSLRSNDEVFATIDVALIDLYSAETTFMKIGSTPTFIKRGSEVLTISANNLPIGILEEIDIDLVSEQLKPGDIMIMMTDGVFDAPGHAVNKEMWMRRIIQEIEAGTPQDIADCLLEKVVRYHHGDIYDDMTVVVARIEKYNPQWATIRWQGLSPVERPKTVS